LAVDSAFEENIAVTTTVAEHVISDFCISTLYFVTDLQKPRQKCSQVLKFGSFYDFVL
jgi:hypothetical protein